MPIQVKVPSAASISETDYGVDVAENPSNEPRGKIVQP